MAMTVDGTNGLTFPNAGTQLYGGCGSGSQTWQNLTGSRSSGTSYTNSTSLPIFVMVVASGDYPIVVVSGVTLTASSSGVRTASFIVPTGATYSITISSGSFASWAELR